MQNSWGFKEQVRLPTSIHLSEQHLAALVFVPPMRGHLNCSERTEGIPNGMMLEAGA